MTSWLKELGLSTAASLARMSFSRMACGASAQPTRKPGARVFEKVPRYTTPSCSTERMAAGGLSSKYNRPYGLSSSTRMSFCRAISRISSRRSQVRVTPPGLWKVGTV